MHLSNEEKKEIFEKYGFFHKPDDTGSPESQIALFSVRIKHLTEHLKQNHKDHATARINRYRAIIAQKELGIRK